MTRSACLALAALCLPGIALGQLPSSSLLPTYVDGPVERLGRYLRVLSASPRDLEALTGAGRAALDVGDANAAVGFFARAEEVAPRDGRVKAGLASALVQMEQPREALKLFDQAVGLGVPEATIAADRGLALDLRGENRRAQADYALALRTSRSDEVVRRLALSQAMSGERAAALATLDPLLRRQDKAAWRASTFVLALTGDARGAVERVGLLVPAGQAAQIAPFLGKLAGLRPGEQAQAVHFGHLPTGAKARSTTALAAAPSTGQALVPTGAPLGGSPVRAAGAGRASPASVSGTSAGGASAPTRNTAPSVAPARTQLATAAPMLQPIAPPPVRGATPEPGFSSISGPVLAQAPTARQTVPSAPITAPPITSTSAALTPAAPAPLSTMQVASAAPATAAGVISSAPPAGTSVSTPVPQVALTALPPSRPALASLVPTTTMPLPVEQRTPAPVAAARPKPVELATPAPARLAAAEPLPAKPRSPAGEPASRPGKTKPAETTVSEPAPSKKARAVKLASAEPIRGKDRSAAGEATQSVDAKAAKGKRAVADEDAKAKTKSAAADARKADDKKQADAKKAKATADAKAAAAKAKKAPERHWVQVATGANKADLSKAWAKVKAQHSATMAGKSAWTTPLRFTNRVLVGPFRSAEEAQSFVNANAKAGFTTSRFTSAGGQVVERLGGR